MQKFAMMSPARRDTLLESQMTISRREFIFRVAQAGGYGEMPRRQREVPLAPRVTEADREAHRAFVATLGDKPIWNEFLTPS